LPAQVTTLRPERPAPSDAAAEGEGVQPAPAGWWDERPPQIGDEAPPLSFEVVYDRPGTFPDPADFSWSDLAGRVVVVDFSTSLCGPCRMLAPHMNELAETLGDEPVSNESEEDIAAFRRDVEFKSLFARDSDGSTFEDYWVNGIPHVAVIDMRGRIAALTHPSALTAENLRAVVRGESPNIARTNESPSRINWNVGARRASFAPEGLEQSVAFAVLTPVEARGTAFRTNPSTGEFSTDGGTPMSLLAWALDMPARSIDMRAELPESAVYRAAVRPGDGRISTSRRMLRAMLEAALAVRVTVTNDPGAVRVLRVADPARLPALAEAGGGRGSMSPGSIDMPSMTFEALARMLTNFTPVPVLDETGLATRHQIHLSYDPQTAGSLAAALASIGLELVEAERPLRRAVVELDAE
jgi:uncharacterized protein (TIGR03435 family)